VEKFRKIFVLTVAVLTLLVISGCGVSKDEHGKTVTELQQTKVELEQAKAKLAEIDKALEDSKIDTKILEKLRSAQQKAGDLSTRVKELTTENEQLKDQLAKVKTVK